jgi:hypothetical protein
LELEEMPAFRMRLARKARDLLWKAPKEIRPSIMREARRFMNEANLLPGNQAGMQEPDEFARVAFEENGALNRLAPYLDSNRLKLILGSETLSDMASWLGATYF